MGNVLDMDYGLMARTFMLVNLIITFFTQKIDEIKRFNSSYYRKYRE